jgi:hypothetical protein
MDRRLVLLTLALTALTGCGDLLDHKRGDDDDSDNDKYKKKKKDDDNDDGEE